MQRNENSKYQPDRPAFAGKTPFEKRMRRALGEDSPLQISKKKTNSTSCNVTTFTILAVAIAIAIFTFNYADSTESSVISELRTKNVVLCGASSGIGEEIAYYVSRSGVANLVISARREEKLKSVSERCLQLGAQNVHIIPADFSKLDSAEEFSSRVLKTLNGVVDVLVLNHAWISARDWVEHLDDGKHNEYVRQMMETNFISYVNVVSSLLNYMESTSGRVLVSSSGAGKGPVHKMAAYSASKHAIHGFFGSLRQDLMWHKSNVTITEAVIGRISTENADNALSGQYEHIGMTDAASTARALILGTLNRNPVIAYPRFQINSLLAFFNLMPRTYDALMLLSANSDPCTNVPYEFLSLFSCAGKIWAYL